VLFIGLRQLGKGVSKKRSRGGGCRGERVSVECVREFQVTKGEQLY